MAFGLTIDPRMPLLCSQLARYPSIPSYSQEMHLVNARVDDYNFRRMAQRLPLRENKTSDLAHPFEMLPSENEDKASLVFK